MVCKLTIFLLGPPSLPEPPTRGWRKVRRWKVLTGRPNRRRKVRRRRCAPSRTSSPTSPSLSDESSSTTTTIRRNWMRRRRTKFSKINATNWKSLNFSELEFNAKQVGPLKVLKSCWSFFCDSFLLSSRYNSLLLKYQRRFLWRLDVSMLDDNSCVPLFLEIILLWIIFVTKAKKSLQLVCCSRNSFQNNHFWRETKPKWRLSTSL